MRATRLAGMALVASALVFAQQTIVKERVIVHSNAPGVPSPPTPPPAPQIEYFAAEFDGAVVKGVPYSAEAVTETTQSLADGNRISRKTTALLFRDSEGRTRREQTLGAIGPWASQSAESPRTVFIHDPVAGVNYVLNSSDHTAQRLPPASGLFELPLPPPPPSPPAPPSTTGNIMYRSSTITHANAGQTKDEQLGKQVIEGVEAEGTRSVVTIPAGQIGNERPIEIRLRTLVFAQAAAGCHEQTQRSAIGRDPLPADECQPRRTCALPVPGPGRLYGGGGSPQCPHQETESDEIGFTNKKGGPGGPPLSLK